MRKLITNQRAMMIKFLMAGFIAVSLINTVFAQVSQERDIRSFKGIENRSSVDLYLYQGSSPRVVIEADESAIDRVETRVEGEILVIEMDRCPMNVRTLKAYITVTDLERLIINGSGDLKTETVLKAPLLEVKVNGSGDALLTLEVQGLNLRINGSGDANVDGSVGKSTIGTNGSGDLVFNGGTMEECTIRVTGSGDIEVTGTVNMLHIKQVSSGDVDAGHLLSNSCSIEKSGSGDTSVWIDGDLSVSLSGSGDVYYRGRTQVKSISVTGSGDVHKIH